jgi:hypothetical protein
LIRQLKMVALRRSAGIFFILLKIGVFSVFRRGIDYGGQASASFGRQLCEARSW